MHSIELAKLAATFVSLSSDMLAHQCVPSYQGGHRYWLEARYRHDFWTGKLSRHRQDLQYLSVANRRRSWQQIIPIIEDVLISEPLSRCIGYHGRLLAERKIDGDLVALSQSVLSSHIEARHRCLHLIVFGEGLPVEQSKRLNQLRRTMEQCNDTLIGFMEPIGPPDPYSFDPLNVHRIQESWQSVGGDSARYKQLYIHGLSELLTKALEQNISGAPTSHQTNAKLHSAVLEFLPESLFDSFGIAMTSDLARLSFRSPEAAMTSENLAKSSLASLGLLFEPNRTHAPPASTEERRW